MSVDAKSVDRTCAHSPISVINTMIGITLPLALFVLGKLENENVTHWIGAMGKNETKIAHSKMDSIWVEYRCDFRLAYRLTSRSNVHALSGHSEREHEHDNKGKQVNDSPIDARDGKYFHAVASVGKFSRRRLFVTEQK